MAGSWHLSAPATSTWPVPMSSITWTTPTGGTTTIAPSQSTSYTYKINPRCYTLGDCEEEWYGGMLSRKLVPGVEYDLPDGAKLQLDTAGNYKIDDKDAQVVYQANRVREFSPHLNASDMLADFAAYARGLGVRRDEVLELPIKLFLAWLVIEAANRDGDEVPSDIVPPGEDSLLISIVKPRCLACNRFIPKRHARHQFPFCNPSHAAFHLSHAS